MSNTAVDHIGWGRRAAIVAVCVGLLGASWAARASAPVLEVFSRPVTVVAYPRGATVVRAASVDLPAGVATVRLAQIPAADPRGRVLVRAKGKTRILRVTVRSVPAAPELSSEVLRLRARAERLATELARLEARARNAAILERFLNAVAEQGVPGGAPAKEVAERYRFLKSSLESLAADLETVQKQRRSLSQEHEGLQKALEQATARMAEARAVEVLVDVQRATAGKDTLLVEYYTPKARWDYAYGLEVTSSTGVAEGVEKAVFTIYGLIRQETGEDWEGVRLHVSGVHAEAMTPPADVPATLRPARDAAAKVHADLALVARLVPRSQVEGVVHIASGGGPVAVPLVKQPVTLPAERVVRPYRVARAYLTVRLRNPWPVSLPAGSLTLLVDGAALRTVRLEALPGGAERTLVIGPDPRLRVVRTLVEYTERSDVRAGQRERRVRIRTRLVNRSTRPLRVELYDRMPLPDPNQPAIRIEDKVLTDAKAWRARRDGIYVRSVALGPGKTYQYTLGYRVLWPSSLTNDPVEVAAR